MSNSEPVLERRLQLDTRRRVNVFLYRGWRVLNRHPMKLFKGRQVATFQGDNVNIQDFEEVK